MALSPLERHAVFAAAAALRGMGRSEASTLIGYTWTHVKRYLDGSGPVSAECERKITDFCKPVGKLVAKVA